MVPKNFVRLPSNFWRGGREFTLQNKEDIVFYVQEKSKSGY